MTECEHYWIRWVNREGVTRVACLHCEAERDATERVAQP